MTSASEALIISRDAIVELIQAIRLIPDGDPNLPEVLEFTVGRKAVSFTGPLRKAQALAMLSAELRLIQGDVTAAVSAESRGGSFIQLGVK